MYLYGYYSTLLNNYESAVINDFCLDREYQISEIYCDHGGSKFDYGILKDSLSYKDALILDTLNSLGPTDRDILDELLFLDNKFIRIMVLDRPETLFPFPESGEPEGDFYSRVAKSNDCLLHEYAEKAQLNIANRELKRNHKCKIKINGNEVDTSAIPNKIQLTFHGIRLAPEVILKARRQQAVMRKREEEIKEREKNSSSLGKLLLKFIR